jgi:hypothetical protein
MLERAFGFLARSTAFRWVVETVFLEKRRVSLKQFPLPTVINVEGNEMRISKSST